MIAITVTSSRAYLHCWEQCIRRIISAASHKDEVLVIYVSDHSDECKKASKYIEKEIPKAWMYIHKPIDINTEQSGEKYKEKSQLLIAALQSEAFSIARQHKCSGLWNVEADILVRPDSLRILEWALSMPDVSGNSYYDVAMSTYWNGHFLGGNGDYAHPIAEDFNPEERLLGKELEKRYKTHKREELEWIRQKKVPDKDWQNSSRLIAEEIRKCPPSGNIWKLNSDHGWHRRGWLDHAYPGVGRGALLPSDWIGTGCVLLSQRALALATFDGYDGKGTQDLYLCWRRWHPSGLRMCVSPHSPCDHVKHEIIDGKHTGKYIHHEAVHEEIGEMRGHLRIVSKPWIPI